MSKMILQDSSDLDLRIGAIMRIRYGTTNQDYIKSSQETARNILRDGDNRPIEETPTTAMQVVEDLTR